MYAISALPKRTTPLIEPSYGVYSPVLSCHKILSRSFVNSTITYEHTCGSMIGCAGVVRCGTGPSSRVRTRVPPVHHFNRGGYKRGPHVFQGGQRHHGRFGTSKEGNGGGGRGGATSGEPALATSLWDMLHADDAAIVSQSLKKPRKMMGMIVVVCEAFELTVSEEAKIETMCLCTKGMSEPPTIFSVKTTVQMYKQTNEFVYLRGNVNHNADLSIEVNRRIRKVWCKFWNYTLELYDRPSAPLECKIPMPRAEVLEIMLYDCVIWSPRACHYDMLYRSHHSFLTHCIGWQKNISTDHPISYLDTLLMKTGSESIEAVVCRRRSPFTGFMERIENTRLSKYVLFGELVGGTDCVGGQRKEWIGVSWTTSELSISTPNSGRL